MLASLSAEEVLIHHNVVFLNVRASRGMRGSHGNMAPTDKGLARAIGTGTVRAPGGLGSRIDGCGIASSCEKGKNKFLTRKICF